MTNYIFLFFSLMLFVAGILKVGIFARMLNIYFSFLLMAVFFIFNGDEDTVFLGVSVVTFSTINLLLWMIFRKIGNVLQEDI